MQYLPFVLALVVGSVVVGVSAVFFLRARFRETIEQSAGSPVAEEVKAIGTQIADALSEQRVQGETQRQLLAQKLDSVRQSVDAQRSHVDGLRSEMRHEGRRRDAEMDEIRSQIGSIRAAVALAPAAQPALPPAAHDVVPEPTQDAAPTPHSEPSAQPDEPSQDEPSQDEPVAPPLAAPLIPPVMAPEPSDVTEDPFGAFTFGDSVSTSPDASAPASAFEAWAPQPSAPSDPETSATPAPSEPEPPASAPEPTHVSAVFEDVTFAPPMPAASAPGPALAEGPDAEPLHAETSAASGANRHDVERDEPPMPAEPPCPAEPPHLITFEDVSFGGVAAQAPPVIEQAPRVPGVDPSWIARPAPPHDPSADDAPRFASAGEMFSTPPVADEATQGLIDLDAVELAAPDAPAPFVAPEDADDLTVISSIDDDVQRRLYLEGVTQLEDIAQWNRTRARQVAVAVQVSEETIMNQWVFEAQAAMFNQFASQSGA